MKMAITSPSKTSGTIEKKPLRVAGMVQSKEKPPDKRVINHLPSTVTTRRIQSPVRRPPSALNNDDRDDYGFPLSSTPKDSSDTKFFRASEVKHATRTPTTSTRKPAFFTADSFSSAPRGTLKTPELRRAESASEAVQRPSNGRPTLSKSATYQEQSPNKRSQTGLKTMNAHLNSSGDFPSPSPSDRPVSSAALYSNERTESRSGHLPSANRLGRQTSQQQLNSGRLQRRTKSHITDVSVNSELGDPDKDRVSMTEDGLTRLQASADGEHTTKHTPSADANLLSSPGSTASVSGATTKSDSFESAVSQPAQTHRKIMDLEIRNTSLLAVNNLLEKQKRKQVSEVKELRRKIAHMQKYPGAEMSGSARHYARSASGSEDEIDEFAPDEDLHDVGTQLLQAASNVDQSIRRAILLSEQLLQDATRGINYKPRESEIGLGLRKVLVDDTPDGSILVEPGSDMAQMEISNDGPGVSGDEDPDISDLNLSDALAYTENSGS